MHTDPDRVGQGGVAEAHPAPGGRVVDPHVVGVGGVEAGSGRVGGLGEVRGLKSSEGGERARV